MNQLDSLQHIPQTTDQPPQQSLFGDPAEAPRTRKKKQPQSRKPSTSTKNYVLDTNVILHDPTCIQRFADNHIWIPVDVLSELDKFKNEQSERGANARAAHRELTRIFSKPDISVTEGAPTNGGGTVRIAVNDPTLKNKSSAGVTRFHHLFPDIGRVDHRILATVLLIQEFVNDVSRVPSV